MPTENREQELLDHVDDAVDAAQQAWTKARDVQQHVDRIVNELTLDRDQALADAKAAERESEDHQRQVEIYEEAFNDIVSEVNSLLDDHERGIWSLDEIRDKVTDFVNAINRQRWSA